MERDVVQRNRSLTLALLASAVVLHTTSVAAQTSMATPRMDNQAAALAAAALLSEDPDIRENAVRVLGERGDAEVVPDLQQALVDPNRRVRAAAIEALADVGGDAALETLALALNDRDPGLREDAVYAAGRIGGSAAKAVAELALSDLEDSVREAAAQVLEELSMAEARVRTRAAGPPSSIVERAAR